MLHIALAGRIGHSVRGLRSLAKAARQIRCGTTNKMALSTSCCGHDTHQAERQGGQESVSPPHTREQGTTLLALGRWLGVGWRWRGL